RSQNAIRQLAAEQCTPRKIAGNRGDRSNAGEYSEGLARMPSTREQLESFHQFAAERLSHGEPEPSLDELLMEWADRRDRPLINESIQRGLADVASGRYEP